MKFWVLLGFIMVGSSLWSQLDSANSEIKTLQEWNQIKTNLERNGYIFSSIDFENPQSSDSLYKATIYKGNKIKNIVLKITYIYGVNYDTTLSREFKNSSQLYSFLSNQVLNDQKSGIVDAQYSLTKFEPQGNILYLEWIVNYTKKLIFNDTIYINTKNKNYQIEFIEKYINKKNQSKNLESKLKYASSLLQQIDYLQIKSTNILPYDSTFAAVINLEPRKIDQIYGILGLMPNGYNTNQIQLTGQILLSLHNLFNQGISTNISWQKTLTNSQFLTTQFQFPYLFKTPIGADLGFSLEKFDTAFLRIKLDIKGNFVIDPFQKVSIIYKFQQSTLDKFNIAEVQAGKLPQYLDYSFNQVGFGYYYSRLDHPYFIHNGFKIQSNILFGKQSIAKNQQIISLTNSQGQSLSYLYDSFEPNQVNESYMIHLEKYTPLSQQWVYALKLQSQGIFSKSLLLNEMYFIGGVNSIRGYDDNSIITPFYTVLNQEFHYYFAKNIYSNIFADIGVFQSSLNKKYNMPLGFGVGLSFQVKGSWVQLNMAAGRDNYENFKPGDIKFHISYSNIF